MIIRTLTSSHQSEMSYLTGLTLVYIVMLAPLLISADMPSEDVGKTLKITEKMYSNIFVRKREEQKQAVRRLVSAEDYSKKYDLLNIALTEILRIIAQDGAKLQENDIFNGTDFPKETQLIEAFSRYVENTCFFGELILHLPDMSYRILKATVGWRSQMIDALTYTRSFVNILDQKSLELLSLLEQEIDESKRSNDYVNPYRESKKQPTANSKKKKSKAKKGPQLTSNIPKTEL
ncbi:coiled-coil domain-containing protein 134-like [Malaya genurostris]|uniref:coiled-coil domain-containing protein 134-like n=1 Tax=Malaya genurostris TaxID=325434 RepID=UPI0026F39C45|nr:coiled-coil domain-containing protein 134-like [Malaya genurostris]